MTVNRLYQCIEQQKQELEVLSARATIRREKYQEFLESLNQPLIKVISGPRRAGKSSLVLGALARHIELNQVAYCNCEDDTFSAISPSGDELLKVLLEIYPQQNFIFLDEVQLLNDWGKFLNKLQRRGYNLVVTGSNAELLSSELASSLTGRHVAIELLPLSFAEHFRSQNSHTKVTTIEQAATASRKLKEYMLHGGYPESYLAGINRSAYISTLVDSVLLRDIVNRYSIKKPESLYLLFSYLISTLGSKLVLTNLAQVAQLSNQDTVKEYVQYFVNAYLGFRLLPFSFSFKASTQNFGKFYPLDTGIVTAKTAYSNLADGKLFETLIGIELFRRGNRPNLELFYYANKSNGYEVDFVINKEGRVAELIQVSFSIDQAETKKRELRALEDAAKSLRCNHAKIITWTSNPAKLETDSGLSVEVVQAVDWLL